jgi:hypothetical protein
MTSGPKIPRSLDLTDASVPTCPLNVDVPWPIDERLRRLVDLVADEKLGPTSKKELAAALIQAADETGLQLWDKVVRYRETTVGDAAFWLPEDEDLITFEGRKPGRRPTS